ncbi:hypothetical protein SeMB42_g05927 [Synchytrium endobioticum]|uniref:Uncharacterized protein n=1 Tax=Synchytrium endobioticum TaxID=286115 RepID=A0A507CN98_9FUNG|nr:hypothetical protein SeMB42_g05927 [Synchytrium endobioticum]
MYKDVQDKPYKDADLYHRRVFDYVMYTNLGSVSWMTVYPGRPFGKPQQPSPLVPGDYRFNRRYTRIVAVDPGINNGVDYDDKDDAMKEMPAIREISLKEWLNQAQLPAKEKGRRLKQLDQSWTYSNDQWKEKTGINLHHRLNQVRLLKHPHVQQVMADIPSACTSQYQDYIHRPQYLVLHLEVLVDYHDKARSSRWDSALVQTGWHVCWRMQDVLRHTIVSLCIQLGIAKHAPTVCDRDYNAARNILYYLLCRAPSSLQARHQHRVGLTTTLNSSRHYNTYSNVKKKTLKYSTGLSADQKIQKANKVVGFEL